MNTVGICAYNEEKSIGKALAGILPQLGKRDEVIVVASGCTDRTVPVVRALAGREQRLRLIVERERKGKTSALNRILREAGGENIILTDADVLLGEGSIKFLMGRLSAKTGGAIARTMPYQREGFFDRMQAFAWRSLHKTREWQSGRGELFALNGYLSAVKRGIVEQMPEGNLVEDWLLGWIIKNKGFEIIYEPRARVYVKAAQNLSDYLRQKSRVRLGQWQMAGLGMPLGYARKPFHLAELFSSRYALPYMALDLFVWGKTYADFRAGRTYWEQVKSSKI